MKRSFKVMFPTFCLLAAVALCVRCGSKAASTGANITITGTLLAGSAKNTSLRSAHASFVGYQLFCVTFANPPVSGTATADASANVSLSLAASGVPFGCFLLDTKGNQVATMSFTNAGTSSRQATFSGNAALGNITVDLTNGVALAAVSSSSNLNTTTPTGLACPVGNWVGTTQAQPSGPCVGKTSALTLTISQNSDSTFKGAFFSTNYQIDTQTCGSFGQNFATTAYSSKALTVTIPTGPFESQAANGQTDSNGHTYHYGSCTGAATFPNVETDVLTANSACTTLSIASTDTVSVTGCQACIIGNGAGSAGCMGCGTVTCSGTQGSGGAMSLTKQ